MPIAVLVCSTALRLALQAPTSPSPAASAAAQEAVQFDPIQLRDRVERDGSYERTLEMGVRLRTAQAVAEAGQIGLPYVDGYGDVRFEAVLIEKADGRRVPVKGIVEDVNPWGITSTSFAADIRFKKMTIPGLEPGDHLSYRMVLTNKAFAPGKVFGQTKLTVPGARTIQYELDLPRGVPIQVRLRDGLGTSWQDAPGPSDRLVRRLSVQLDPAKATESLKATEPDVIFSGFASWEEIAQWWWGISKERLKPEGEVAAEASRLAASAPSPREKLAALHAFLTGRIRYVNVSFGLGRMQPRKAAEILTNRYGDCKDKHALLAAMATSLGIDVRPVLINSEAELHDDAPSPGQFDHVISVARLGPTPEEWLWLDGTNDIAVPGYLAPGLRDKRAMLVEADGRATLVRTPKDPPFVPRQEVAVKGTLSRDGVLRGRVTWVIRSDSEPGFRKWLASGPPEGRTAGVGKYFGHAWGGGPVSNVVVSDLDANAPLRVEFDAEKSLPGKGSERTLWVPLAAVRLPDPDADPSEGAPEVTFDLRDMTERAEIELPEGQSARAPLSVSMERPFGTFHSSYSLEGRTLRLERTLRFSQGSVAQADLPSYEAFRGAVEKDHKQEFTISGVVAAVEPPATAPAATAASAARSLHAAGLDAFNKKDFAKASELFKQAGETDPKERDVFVDLGRSLIDQRKYEEALQAFSRQIEVTPFHEMAYAWRAHSRRALKDWEGAEKDFLKQIEVAPFQAWPYEQLARRREEEERYPEAAELFGRVATLEPKIASRWLDLARVQVKAGRAADAHQSLDQATKAGLVDSMQVQAAGLYHDMGDEASAGRIAAEALPVLAARLAGLEAAELSSKHVEWFTRLLEAWRYVGRAAVTAGDLERGEKYLRAAWEMGLDAQSGWALGELREKQGRMADAVELWSMAASTHAGGLPVDGQKRIDDAVAALPAVTPPSSPPDGVTGAYEEVYAGSGRQAMAERRLRALQTLRLPSGPGADISSQVLVLVADGGQVERFVRASGKASEEFQKLLSDLGTARLDWPRPDDQPLKAVRAGRLQCGSASGCAVLLDIPGRIAIAERPPARVKVVKVDPPQESVLHPGQKVALTVTLHYRIPYAGAELGLGVDDKVGIDLPPGGVTKAVQAGEGDVTLTTTFEVPKGQDRIFVIMPLSAPGYGSTSTVFRYDVR